MQNIISAMVVDTKLVGVCSVSIIIIIINLPFQYFINTGTYVRLIITMV